MKEKFLKGIEVLSARCNFNPTEWDIDAYIMAFEEVGFEKGVEAIKIAFLRLRGGSQMPSPMDLMGFVGVKMPDPISGRDEGINATASILAAVSKFGLYQPFMAKDHLGPKLWRVVEMAGGWQIICGIEIDQLPTWKAQLRELAESISKMEYFEEKQNQLDSAKNFNVANLIEATSSALDIGRGKHGDH